MGKQQAIIFYGFNSFAGTCRVATGLKGQVVAFVLLLPLLFSVQLHAQSSNELLPGFRQINEELQQNPQGYNYLKEACAMGHRLSGTPNGAKAEEYALKLFKSFGYKNAYLQEFEFNSWQRETATLELVPHGSDNYQIINCVSLALTPLNTSLSADIIDAGNGQPDDWVRLGAVIKGKIALVNIGLEGLPASTPNLHRSRKTLLAIQAGAAGVIFVNSAPGSTLLTGTASTTGSLVEIPAICISNHAGKLVRGWLKEELLIAEINVKNTYTKARARNIVATYEGKGLKNENILVGAHWDSWDLATGAIDNGIGAMAVMDMARVFKASKLKTRRNVTFVLFMGEEEGILGSKAFADANPTLVANTRYMINCDMSGNAKGFNIMGRPESNRFVGNINELIQKVDTAYRANITSEASLHSDHLYFMLQGIPTIEPVADMPDKVYHCYHANCDNIGMVQPAYVNTTARYTAMLAYGLATTKKLQAPKLNPTDTRDWLIKQGLKQSLIETKDWRWEP